MIRYTSSGHRERSEGPRKDVIGFHWLHDNPSFDCEVLRFAHDDTRLTIQALTLSTRSVLFALVFLRWHDAIVHCVRMKHYRDQIEEEETEAPAGRCERSQ